MEQEHTEKEIQVVAFVLNNEEFACDINNVREVLKMVKVTPLPQSLSLSKG